LVHGKSKTHFCVQNASNDPVLFNTAIMMTDVRTTLTTLRPTWDIVGQAPKIQKPAVSCVATKMNPNQMKRTVNAAMPPNAISTPSDTEPSLGMLTWAR
jgi:hypothetical protein